MHLFFKISAFTLLAFTTTNCNQSKQEKAKESSGIEPTFKEKIATSKGVRSETDSLTLIDAVRLAEKQFEKYLPKILDAHDAGIDLQQLITGDFTGDGIDDIAIYFSLAPREGGNAIVGQGIRLYQNTGKTVKVLADYDPDYLFSFDKIENGKIYVDKLEYAEDDGRCCPSIKTEHILTISGNKAY